MSSSSGGDRGHVGASEDPDMLTDTIIAHQQHKSEQTNQRFSSLIHDSEVFLTKLREFKPQSLGCLEARRKSSSTLIFPSPQQACMGAPKCPRYPHNVKPTPGYWIECHGPGILPSSCKSGHGSTVSNQEGRLVDDGSKSSGRIEQSTLISHHNLPTTQTAEGVLTRHDKDTIFEPHGEDIKSSISAAMSSKQQEIFKQRPQSFDDLEQSEYQLGFNDPANDGREHSRDNDPSHVDPSSQNNRSDQEQSTANKYHHSGLRAKSSKVIDSSDSSAEVTKTTSAALTSTGSLRRKFNKRTMTRDDIDLHKPRRGTPNITITEPSFNQSTITYQPSLRNRKGPVRQASQGGSGGDSHDADEASSSMQPSKPRPTAVPNPIKFHIQRYMSNEKDQDLKYQDQPLGRDDSIERQESSESEDLIAGGSGSAFESSKYESYRPQMQQHRPSIIREDIDNEGGIINEHVGYEHHQQHHYGSTENKEFYCGLSTTTFNKKCYQQAYQESIDTSSFKDGSLELISFEEENYEKHYYGREHWNYFTNDELLGPVMLSLKQEVNNQRDHFHVLLRTVSYTLHGTIPASTICADRYDREAIVRELSEIAKLKPPLMLGQLPSTPDELLKLDHIFIKTELKVGVIYIRSGQAESEESILSNKEESPLFTEFLDLLGDRITLKGFDRYKGGLDTVHNLTGTESVYTMWRNIEIMFHVSTMLPHEENDPQKLQKKRHIGNDIVCVAFIESDDTLFWPGCIKSYFLHTFIAVKTSPKPLKDGEKRKYSVSCVCRNEVQHAFRPYLVEQDDFLKSDYFREWLLVKIVNGERASYSAPKFARMQDRTRSQLLEDITTSLANHLVTGQIPKPYRRGSWRPLGHTRASSPLEDSMKDYFEDYDHLARDFCNAFCGPSRSMLCDVVFRVKDSDGTYKLVHGVRAIMAIRSRTFLEMLYGFVPPGTGPTSLQNQTNLRAIEMRALSGDSYVASSSGGNKDTEHTKSLLAKRGSVGIDSSRKTGEKERRQSMLPNLSKSTSQKPNYLTVPSTSGGGSNSGGTGGMIKNAFNRLVSGNWSGWSGNIKSYKGEPMHIKVDQNKTKVDFNSLAICKEIAKIDADKLAQREFEIKEFDYETFQQTIEYIHNGQCKLSYETIPGLICAAEHYDLPDLLHACFHHANTHMRLSAAPKMMNALYQNSCFYITAMQLLDSIYDYIDPHGNEFFSRPEYLELYESVFTTLLSRKTLQISELKKFQAMHGWARNQVVNRLQHKQQAHQQQFNDQKLKSIDIETIDNLSVINSEEAEIEYKNLMIRLNKEVNIKLDRISNEDLVKVVLPTKVFGNDKIFEVMADEDRID